MLRSVVRAAPLHAGSRSRSHQVHTPARRLFRSIVSLPQQQAAQFAAAAMRALRRAAVDDWTEDVTRAFAWWSNVQHLRVLLQQLQDGDVTVAGEWGWLREELDPQLLVRLPRSAQ